MRYLNIALISGLIFAPLALSAAEAVKSNGEKLSVEVTEKPKLTRENLLAHGFKQSEKNKDSFVAEHARLGDVESALGFQITALRPTVSQSRHSDVRQGLVEGKQVLVKSEVRDEKGRIVPGSLDKPDAICTVYISLKKLRAPKAALTVGQYPARAAQVGYGAKRPCQTAPGGF